MADNVLGASGEADAPTTYWICKGCPLPEECSQSCWKKWKVWGNNLEECKEQVMEHLRRSGSHQEWTRHLGGQDRSDYFQQKVEAAEYEEVPVPTPAATRGTKRRHQSEDADGGDGDAEGIDLAGVQREVRNVVLRERNAAHWDIARALIPGAETDAIVPPSPPRRMRPRVSMSVEELKALIDALKRASKSASNLARLCASAAQTCWEEKAVIDEARDAMRALIEAAGFQWSPSS